MIKSETREIEDLTVTTQQLPAMRAYSVFARLGKIIGPALAAVQGVSVSNLEELDVSEIAPAIGKALEGLAEDEPLVLKLLASTFVVLDGKKIELTGDAQINRAFSGRFKALLLTLKFALEVNFSDFLDGKLAGLGESPEAESE